MKHRRSRPVIKPTLRGFIKLILAQEHNITHKRSNQPIQRKQKKLNRSSTIIWICSHSIYETKQMDKKI